MQGKTQHECEQTLLQQGNNTTAPQQLVLPGNRPSNTLLLADLNAKTLGALLAFYEHSTFVQATIWQINPFDQWGVEEGKRLATQMENSLLPDKGSDNKEKEYDASTEGLINAYQRFVMVHCVDKKN